MITNLSRPEELTIKDDIGRIRKAIEDLSNYFGPPAPPEDVVSDHSVDPFFGKIHISDPHLNAVGESYEHVAKLECVGLMEECSELIQALSKQVRYHTNIDKEHVIEEMAHVIICIRLVCSVYGIEPSDIQKEIMRKYPEGYKG